MYNNNDANVNFPYQTNFSKNVTQIQQHIETKNRKIAAAIA